MYFCPYNTFVTIFTSVVHIRNVFNWVWNITCLFWENASLELWGIRSLAHKSLWCVLLEEKVLMLAVFFSYVSAAGCSWRKGTDLEGYILIWLLLCPCIHIVWAAGSYVKSCPFLLSVTLLLGREVHQLLQFWEAFSSTSFSHRQHLGSNNVESGISVRWYVWIDNNGEEMLLLSLQQPFIFGGGSGLQPSLNIFKLFFYPMQSTLSNGGLQLVVQE